MRYFWQFKNGRLAPMEYGWDVPMYYAWDRSLGAWVAYAR